MTETRQSIRTALKSLESATTNSTRRQRLLALIKTLPEGAEGIDALRKIIEILSRIDSADDKRMALQTYLAEIPLTGEFLALYEQGFIILVDAIEHIKDPRAKKTLLMHIAEGLPADPDIAPYFKEAIKRAIEAANEIEDHSIRRNSLALITERLPKNDALTELCLYAMELALGQSDTPICKKYTLKDIAAELPRTCDYEFYRMNTYIGITQRLPRTKVFSPLYRAAMETSIKAAHIIEEPYYEKYALVFIAHEVSGSEQYNDLYRTALIGSLNAALKIHDTFVRHFSLIEVLEELPKAPEYYTELLKTIEEILPFYSVKSRMDDVDMLDVIDYIIVAEERKINENKKKRYSRENYADKFAREVKKFTPSLTDIRFIEVFRPYTHVWVQKALRDAARGVVDHLEALKERFHGSEVTRPIFVTESRPEDVQLIRKITDSPARQPSDAISIDLGATNTVIMKKRINAEPHYINLSSISRKFGEVESVPTLLSLEASTIGMEAINDYPVTNIKKLLLNGNPKGKQYMEKFFQILYRHLKTELTPAGWIKALSGKHKETFYLTVPVGFQGYRKDLMGIVKQVARGMNIDFIDEPLAAAIGYQVAEKRDKVIMIIDFGGCTLDVMVLRININAVHVVAKPDKSQMLGGADIDYWISEILAEKAGVKIEPFQRDLLIKAEEIKIALSKHKVVPFEWNGKEICTIDVNDFEEILDSRDFYKTVDRAIAYVLNKTAKIGITKDKIEAVLITGGSSQIPSFKDKICDIFPALSAQNAIYDHNPLSAVATGAVYYGTREVTDRHLTVAYALKHITGKDDRPFAYELIFEKGEHLPFEKTFRLKAGKTRGAQNKIFLELFEVPEELITRRWENESGLEYIKQIMKQPDDMELHSFKILTLDFDENIEDDLIISFNVDQSGWLSITYEGGTKEVDGGVRLQ